MVNARSELAEVLKIPGAANVLKKHGIRCFG